MTPKLMMVKIKLNGLPYLIYQGCLNKLKTLLEYKMLN